MKSFFTSVVAVFVASILFFSCGSTKFAYPDYAELSQSNTPENSVVIVFQETVIDSIRVQIDPSFPHDRFKLARDGYFTPPLKPGSTYIRMYDDENFDFTEIPCISVYYYGALNYEEEYSIYGKKIHVPTKPGLYFANGLEYRQISLSETKQVDKKTLKKIKKAAKVYKGTSWESFINEKLEEMSK